MFSWLKSREIEDETPPYLVMEACGALCFQTPLEVRWHRVSRFRNRHRLNKKRLRIRLLDLFFRLGSPMEINCPCGQPLPNLEAFTLKVLFEPEIQYLLGQCRQCRTIYWEVAELANRHPTAGIWWD
jgi:hypothetical protein